MGDIVSIDNLLTTVQFSHKVISIGWLAWIPCWIFILVNVKDTNPCTTITVGISLSIPTQPKLLQTTIKHFQET